MILNCIMTAQKYDHIWLLGYGSEDPMYVPKFGFSFLKFGTNSLEIEYQLKGNDRADNWLNYVNVSNHNGEFAFYTNGACVFNRNHEVMVNGDTLNPGNIWNGFEGFTYPVQNGSIVLPHPADDEKFVIIHKGIKLGGTVKEGYNYSDVLYYSIVDMTLEGGVGAVTTKNQVLIRDTLNESQTAACRHANGRDWWIPIRHGVYNLYYLFLLDPSGIHLHHQQAIGLAGPGPGDTFNGNACFSPDGTKYACCLREDHAQIFDFDRCTGWFSNPVHLYPRDSMNYATSVCFSPNSRFLYFNDVYRLWQYDLSRRNIQESEVLVAVWDTFYYKNIFSTAFFQTRLAPDGRIYMSMFGGSNIYLHRVNRPDEKGKACNFIQRDVALPNYHSGILPYFPNFKLGPLVGSSCDSLYRVDLGKSFLVSPNPVREYLHIEFLYEYPFRINYEFELFNLQGVRTFYKELDNSTRTHQVPTEQLPDGMYLYRIVSEGVTYQSGKIFKG